MECNKEEAMRAKEIAETRMENKDFAGARKIALKAQKLFPDLESISNLISVCDVHISSQNKVLDEKDWYSILNIDPSADESAIKRQYRKYALSLHPDKNKFPGSTDAFKLIGEAQRVLLDSNKRAVFDNTYKAAKERPKFNVTKPTGVNNHSANKGSGPKSQPSGFSNDKSSFWTLCPACCLKYKFRVELVNRSVWCPTCKMYFIGREIDVQNAPPQKKGKPKTWFDKVNSHQACKNSTSKRVYQENVSSTKRARESVPSKESQEMNKKFKPSEKCANAGAKTDKDGVKRARESVQTKESSEMKKKSKSSEDCADAGAKIDKDDVDYRPHRCTQSNLHAYYGTRSTRSQFSKKDTNDSKTPDSGFAHVKDELNKVKVKDDMDKVEVKDDGFFRGSSQNGNKENDSGKKEVDFKNVANKSICEDYLYPDPDFSNFDKFREEECFRIGQIWALYDTLDAMPRFYALIKDIIQPGFKLLVSWLEPISEDKEQVKWVCEGLPVSCGRFKFGDSEIIEDRLMFSHLVQYEKENGSNTYVIYPKKGETWALFKNWDPNWLSDQVIKEKIEYEYVEIVSEYIKDTGVFATCLVKAKGFSCLFCLKDLRSFQVFPNQLFRFSHRIPSIKMSGEEREDVPKGSFEFDLTSVPPNLEEFDIHSSKGAKKVIGHSGISKANLDSDFSNDFDIKTTEKCFSAGQIWALYDCLDTMPRFYALIKEVSLSPLFKVQLTWLEPNPIENDEIKWVNEGLPVSCGKFKLGNFEIVDDHLAFSHLVSGQMIGELNAYQIYPRRGETWALFKNWNRKWTTNLESKKSYQFEYVEILSHYDASVGVSVAYLDKVEDSSCLFRLVENGKRTFQIPPNEKFRFSHKIPSLRMNGDDQKDGLKGSTFKLDPDSLPIDP